MRIVPEGIVIVPSGEETLDRSYYPEHRDYAIMMLILDSGMRLGESK